MREWDNQVKLNSVKREDYSTEKPIPDNIKCWIGEAKNIGDFLSFWLENRLLDPPHQEVLDNYYWSYRRHFGQRMRDAYSEQIREAIQLVQSHPGARVLEMGCGLGTESLWLAVHGANVVAVDVIGSLIRAARRRKEILEELLGRSLQCEFCQASVMDLDERESFDVIWMEQAFQHLEPREAVVKKTVRLTKPGGRIIISEVNALNPLMQIQLFVARGMKMYFTYVDENGKETVMGNERIVTARWLKRLFEPHNVHCENIRYFRIFPNHRIFNNLSRVEKLLARRWLAPLQTHFNYVGQRKG